MRMDKSWHILYIQWNHMWELKKMHKATLINMDKSQKHNVEEIKQVAEYIQDGALLGVPRPLSGLMIQ